MMHNTKEHLLHPDELLALNLRYERVGMLKLQPLKADRAIEHMVRMQERLGDTASNLLVPKDYTKPQYEPLPSEPTQRKNAFEQALVGVEESSQKQVPELDQELVRMLVEQSFTPDEAAEYVQNGIKDVENFMNSLENDNVR